MSSFRDNLSELLGRYPYDEAAMSDYPSPELLRSLVNYDSETGALTWKPRADAKCGWNKKYAGKPAFGLDCGHQGYLAGKLGKHKLYAHRVIWAIMHGSWPEYVDHIDRDKKNNRLVNLRAVSNQENSRNASANKANTSGIKGVCWHRGGQFWTARITVNYKSVHLGSFKDKDEAIRARRQAELKYGFVVDRDLVPA